MSEHDTHEQPKKQDEVEYRPLAGHPNYQVGSDGSVWRYYSGSPGKRQKERPARWKKVNGFKNWFGYLMLSLRENNKYRLVRIHRLILETFVGPCPIGMEACHNNGNPTDNRLSNLRWDTHQNNVNDMIRHGTKVQGRKKASAKFTEDQIRHIRAAVRAGTLQKTLAKQYGVHPGTICLIVKRRRWAYLDQEEST